MSQQVLIELVSLIPNILWVILVAILIVVFYRPLKELLPRIGGVKAFGIEVTLIQVELDNAVAMREKALAEESSRDEIPEIRVSGNQRLQLLRRVKKVAPIIKGAQILWVDDKPAWNISERKVLRSLDIFVDLTRSSTEALSMILQIDYDAVISNIGRPELGEDRIQEFLADIRQKDPKLSGATIFYVGKLRPENGVPPNAHGITNRPDELLHLVLDILERKRS